MTSPSTVRPTAKLRALFAGALVAAAALAFVPAAYAQDADPVIARVNGIEVRESDVTLLEEELGSQIQQMPAAQRREYLISILTDTLLVAQAAEQKGLPDTPDFKRRLAFARTRLLSEMLLTQEAKGALTEENLRKVYAEAVAQMGNEEEVHARHILFRVEDPANQDASRAAEAKVRAAIERLRKGEDFAKLANELTEDPSGKENGGDLGFFTKDQMVPEFAEVAFRLDKGAISDPVKTQFGWHVLKVEDKRKKPVPPFEEVRDQLETYAIRRAQTDFVTKLRQGAKVERVAPPATR